MKSFAKKILIFVSALLCVGAMLVLLYACGGQTASISSVCDHNYRTTTVAATCTATGYTLHTCTKCGDSYKDDEVVALGHSVKSEWKTNSTQHWHECENGCGELLELENHDWDDGVIEIANSCESNGKIVFTCKTCGFSRADVLPATGHNIQGGWVTSDSNTHWRVCANGNHKVDEALHNWDSGHIEKAPTCEEEGSIVYTCMICGKSTRRTLSKTAHNKSKEWDFDESEHWRDCLVCGDEFDRGSHVFSTSYVTKQPTCFEAGTRVSICSICGNYIKTEIPPLGHKPATKWSYDNKEHWHKCENGCGEKFAVAEHTFGDWEEYLDPTCTTKGLKKRVCSVCGKAEYESIDATGHDIDTEHFEYDADKHWHECKNCDGKFDSEEHALTIKEIVAPTATERGYTIYLCEECGYEVKGDFTDPLGE